MDMSNSRTAVLASFLEPSQTHRVLALSSGLAAFDSRRWLIRNARRRIWISSFLWRNDRIGNDLVDELANRARDGLDVRILIDHWGATTSQDAILYRFRQRIRTEGLRVRLFNPIAEQVPQTDAALVYAGVQNASELNHRMHSKIAVFDDHAAIAGGRNVGDEYFDLHGFRCFADAELLLGGPSVPVLSDAFRKFWDSRLSVDLQEFRIEGDPEHDEDPRRRNPEQWKRMLSIADRCCPDYTSNVFEPDEIRVVYDSPAPDSDQPSPTAEAVLHFFTTATRRLQITSPIVIFPDSWLESLRSFRSETPALRSSLLTNSLVSADNLYTYAAGVRQRRQILREIRMRLYELRAKPRDIQKFVPSYEQLDQQNTGRDAQPASGLGANRYECRELHTTLHAKYAVADRERLLLGSPNLDPRSLFSNMELVLIIDGLHLAEHFAKLHDLGCGNRNSWVVAQPRRSSLPRMLTRWGVLWRRWTGLGFFPDRTPSCFEPQSSTADEIADPSAADFADHYQSCGPYPGVADSDQSVELFLMKNLTGLMRRQL